MPDSLRVPGFIAIGLVLLAYFMAESGRLLLALVRRHRRPPQDHGTLPAIAATFVFSEVAAFAFLLFAPRLDFAGRRWAWQLAGAACVVLGAAIRAAAVRALGEAYSPVVTVTPGQSIVSGGPYRLVRHPAYSGALIMLAGGGLASGNAAGLAVCVLAPLVVLIARIRVEERTLLAELGATYGRYIQGRKRLMPFVW